jgi:hypothetical protein
VGGQSPAPGREGKIMSSVEKLIKILIAVFIFLDCLLIGGMAFLLFDEIWRSLL